MLSDRGRSRSSIRTPSTTSLGSVHHAPRRATSHHIPSTVDQKTNEDLRHTALRKGIARTSSASTIDTVARAPPMPAARPEQRWSGFRMGQKKALEEKASISPLTQGPSVTKSEKAARGALELDGAFKADNSDFRAENSDYRCGHKDDRNGCRAGIAAGGGFGASKDSGFGASKDGDFSGTKDSGSARNHGSMFSLVPMSRSHTESEESLDDEHGVFTEYDDDELALDLENATTMLDFMKESSQKHPQEHHRSTRTHQKVLQMKDFSQMKDFLRMKDFETMPAGRGFGNSFDYAVKIQHEAVSSQWDQIRLRFSSRSDRKSRPMCSAGMLGSVQRLKSNRRAGEGSVTRDNVAEYLQSMWDSDATARDSERTGEYSAEDEDIYQDRTMGARAQSVVWQS